MSTGAKGGDENLIVLEIGGFEDESDAVGVAHLQALNLIQRLGGHRAAGSRAGGKESTLDFPLRVRLESGGLGLQQRGEHVCC